MPNIKLEHINYNGTTYDIGGATDLATQSTSGLMSASDKTKLDSVATNANYTTVAQTITNGKQIAVFSANGSETPIYDSRDILFGTSDTAATTSAKTASTVNGDFVLATGAMVRVKFTNANTYNGAATLNVDGTGAHNITRVGTTTSVRYFWTAGEVVDFVYDGTNFVMSNKGVASVTYYGLTKLTNSHTSTSSSLAATASAVKDAYDRADAAYTLAESKSTVNSITPTYTTGTLINEIEIDGTEYSVYIPPYPTVSDLGLSKALKFIGFSTTSITDGQTTTPTISGLSSYTPAVGDVVIDASNASATSQYEYVYTSANKWERLGGDNTYALAGTEYDVSNGGTNAKSAVTISPNTTSIYSMTSTGSVEAGTETTFSMSVSNEILTFSFEANSPTVVTLPGRSNAINAWTGYNTGVNNTYAAAQAFTASAKTITIN